MLGRFGTVIFAVLAIGSMAGCAQEAVRVRAQSDLHCTDEDVRVIEMSDGYHAYGCGDHAVYDVENHRRHYQVVRTD